MMLLRLERRRDERNKSFRISHWHFAIRAPPSSLQKYMRALLRNNFAPLMVLGLGGSLIMSVDRVRNDMICNPQSNYTTTTITKLPKPHRDKQRI